MRITRRPCQSPSTVVKQESEGTDENYQSSYAIHCAALELLKKDGFQFRYTFEDKDDYNSYMERYTAAYTEKSDLIRAGGFKIYTSLDSRLQDMLQADIDQGLSSYTELQDNGKVRPPGRRRHCGQPVQLRGGHRGRQGKRGPVQPGLFKRQAAGQYHQAPH